jgi:hypothetical protein
VEILALGLDAITHPETLGVRVEEPAGEKGEGHTEDDLRAAHLVDPEGLLHLLGEDWVEGATRTPGLDKVLVALWLVEVDSERLPDSDQQLTVLPVLAALAVEVGKAYREFAALDALPDPDRDRKGAAV